MKKSNEKFDSKNFEQLPREIERKFAPLFPELLAPYKQESLPIEQFYLSHPSEPFSLRLRESFTEYGKPIYEATLKDRGATGREGLDRLEVTCQVSQELYEYYKTGEVPIVRKLRAEPLPGVTIDFYDDASIMIESEHSPSWTQFVAQHGNVFVDVTDDRSSTNEWKAHIAYRRNNAGKEALAPIEDLDSNIIVNDILSQQLPYTPTVVHIGGRSGSGKSTLVNQLREKLATSRLLLDSLTISTDDYHRGTTWLTAHNGGEPWTKWDAPIVYDTQAMRRDINTLISRRSVPKRSIDWTSAEPIISGVHEPASVIIVEGIYAMSPEITHADDLCYEMPTSLATCIGRRLLRDIADRPEFADPHKSLHYILSEAEPAYREQRART